jgi:AcrR family transcriptional regulator
MAVPKTHSPNPPKWKRRPEARADEILSAAIEVFGDVGFARAKLEDVAKKAGVSKGTLYLYFDSKEELFRRLVVERIIPCFQEAEQYLRESQGSARDMLEWYIRRKWETIRKPEMVRIARLVHAELVNFPELARFYFEEVILRSRSLLNQILERGISTGEFRKVPHDFVLRAVPSLLVNGAMYQRGFGAYDPHALTDEELLEGILDLVLQGVLARKV